MNSKGNIEISTSPASPHQTIDKSQPLRLGVFHLTVYLCIVSIAPFTVGLSAVYT